MEKDGEWKFLLKRKKIGGKIKMLSNACLPLAEVKQQIKIKKNAFREIK